MKLRRYLLKFEQSNDLIKVYSYKYKGLGNDFLSEKISNDNFYSLNANNIDNDIVNYWEKWVSNHTIGNDISILILLKLTDNNIIINLLEKIKTLSDKTFKECSFSEIDDSDKWLASELKKIFKKEEFGVSIEAIDVDNGLVILNNGSKFNFIGIGNFSIENYKNSVSEIKNENLDDKKIPKKVQEKAKSQNNLEITSEDLQSYFQEQTKDHPK